MEMCKKSNMPYNFMPIKREIGYIAELMVGLLSFYVYPDASITDQIQNMSTASCLLFVLYREHRTSFIPAQLYHDLNMSFIDALFCRVKTKYHTPDEPLKWSLQTIAMVRVRSIIIANSQFWPNISIFSWSRCGHRFKERSGLNRHTKRKHKT